MKRIFAILVALGLAGTAQAHGTSAGALEIIHPNIPAPAPNAVTAAGYMAISNGGDHADRLIGVATPAAEEATLHETQVSADGVASMVHVDGLDIAAGDTAVLEPGGYHIMLLGLTAPLIEGQMVPATLIFEHAGAVEIEFMVDPPGGMDHGEMDHGEMNHGQMDGGQMDGGTKTP